VIGLDLLTKLVQRLDEAELEVLFSRYLDDLTQEEIAVLLGLSRKTVGKRLDRVREVVRSIVEHDPGRTP
jgi:RNA polymerase sigma-70 factor (ECF subfamily)